MARLIGLLELAAPDLVEPYRRHEDGVLVEELVHLLVDPLGLYRYVVEVHLPKEGRAQLGDPVHPRPRLPLGGHVAGRVQHRLQGQLGVGDYRQVGREDPSYLARVYVYVDELAIPPVHVEIPCVPLGPAVADAHHEVALQEEGVGVALAGLDADGAHVEGVILGDRALPHVGRANRDLQVLGELRELFGGLRDDDSSAGHQDGTLGLQDHLYGLPDGVGPRRWLLEVQRAAAPRVEVHLHVGLRHIEREVYEDGAGPAFLGYAEGLPEGPHQLGRLLDLHGTLGHRLGYLHDVHRLEGLLVEHGRGGLPGNTDHRYRVGQAGVEARDHVRPRRARRSYVDPHLPRDPRVAVGGVRAALLVPHGVVLYLLGFAQSLVEWQDGRPRHPEGHLDP